MTVSHRGNSHSGGGNDPRGSGWVQPGAALGPDAADGDSLARHIRNEVGRTFYATGGAAITGDQAFVQIMARAKARTR